MRRTSSATSGACSRTEREFVTTLSNESSLQPRARSLPSRARSRAMRWLRTTLGVLRVMTYAFVASLVCAGLGARVVYAKFEEGSLQAGRELAGLNDVLGSTKTLVLNGTTLNLSTAATDQAPSEVLDRFETMCK